MKKGVLVDIIVRLITIILSVFIIVISYKKVATDLDVFQNSYNKETIAEVTEIINKDENKLDVEDSSVVLDVTITFNCKVLKGEYKGQIVTATQVNNAMSGTDLKEVEPGDKVMIFESDYGETNSWILMNYYRIDRIIILAIIFFILILIITRKKGLNILITLIITCSAIFFVFVPSILAGVNIYVSSLVVCFFIIVSTLLILNGPRRKTLATILGCFSGVIVAGIIAVIMDKVLCLTGVIDEHSIYIQLLNTETPINLKAIIFASIIIGAMGAVMDVAMDISSSLYEIKLHVKGIGFRKLVKSGMSIGHDIMGTMSNTLILAYIGSSLSSILLLITYSSSFIEMLNKEKLIVEMLQALVGSIGILITIPLTTIACGILYGTKKKFDDNSDVITAKDMNSNTSDYSTNKLGFDNNTDIIDDSNIINSQDTINNEDTVVDTKNIDDLKDR